LENKLPFYAAFLIVLLFSQSFGAGIRCGTANFLENSQKKLAKASYSAATFSGEVKKKESKPFVIYYTTEGLHATSESYVDSLIEYLHQAYELHTKFLGMDSILGAARTYFYQQRVQRGFYPVEVVDLGAEDTDNCGVLGAVFAPLRNSETATQIAMENNFIYDAYCYGYGNPGDSMADYPWNVALKLTVFHELYHSFQAAYTPIADNTIFWAEASATGVEEIGMPEVDDYINYLFYNFHNNLPVGISIDSLSKSQYYYGYASLYLFLFSELGAKFDRAIWSNFSKNPSDKFSMQLARLADSLGYDPEELFNEYAKRLFYSGSRAGSSSFWVDMQKWPTWNNVKTTRTSPLPAGTFDFIRKTSEEIPKVDSAAIIASLEKYPVWVLSRLLEKKFVPQPPPKEKIEFAAFPNPWNPKQNPVLYFNLPEKTEAVEIRASNGALLERVRGEAGKPLAWQPKKIPAPGILYYRTLPYGKNKVLIVSY
jgi:hypothetical protein